MKQSYEEIRKIRHDMKNYLECAATLLYNGKEKEAQNYLNCLLEDKLSVGNPDCIYKSECNQCWYLVPNSQFVKKKVLSFTMKLLEEWN